MKIRLALILTAICLQFPGYGVTYKFIIDADSISETYNSSFFDDDVDVSFTGHVFDSNNQEAVLEKGDIVTIDYTYKHLYTVTSNDDADVDFLRFEGRLQGGKVISDMTVQLSDKEGKLIGKKMTKTGIGWSPLGVAAESENDVLGSLKGLTIHDFHAELTLTAATEGKLFLTTVKFGWEAGSITKTALPDGGTTSLLLVLSLAGLITRKTLRTS